MKKIALLSLVLFIYSLLHSQEYEIEVRFKDFKDSTVYLGFHHAKQMYIADSAHVDNNGLAVFRGDKKLENGIYFISPAQISYFEIILGNDRFFSIETDTTDYLASMKVKNSLENSLFLDYNIKLKDLVEKRQKLFDDYEKNKDNEEEAKKITEKIEALNTEREEYMNGIIEKYPNYFLSKYLKSQIDIKIPEAPVDEEGNVDNNFRYLYLKEHFFDNYDLSERGFVRSPYFEKEVDRYFSNMVINIADSLIKETNQFIQKVYDAGDSLMFQYVTSYLLNTYQSSKILGMDAVFISIAENWYLKGKTGWADSVYIHQLDSIINKISPTQIGKMAPDLVRMEGFDGNFYTLSEMPEKFIILIFYEPNCGHCKKEIPELMKAYRDTLKDLNTIVFAVYNLYDKEEWEKFIEKHNLIENGWYNVWDKDYRNINNKRLYNIYSTPKILILDKNKIILSNKSLVIDQMVDMISFYENRDIMKEKEDE